MTDPTATERLREALDVDRLYVALDTLKGNGDLSTNDLEELAQAIAVEYTALAEAVPDPDLLAAVEALSRWDWNEHEQTMDTFDDGGWLDRAAVLALLRSTSREAER